MGSNIVKAGTSSGIISPVSGGNTNAQGFGGMNLMSKALQQAQAQKQISARNPEKYNQILAAVQKRKAMRKGGRVGYADGSQPQISQQQIAMVVTMLKKGADMDTISSITGLPPQAIQMIVSKFQQGLQQKTPGGITGFQKGGMSSPRSDPNPDAERNDLALKLFGRPLHQLTPEELDQLHEYIMNKQAKGGIMEIDYRDEGGFVPPIGKKERADDIPAMLSNNEFVFTADAVRNAGGGSVKEGAKKMYALMKKLEGK